MSYLLDFSINNHPKNIPNPPGYVASSSLKDSSRTQLMRPESHDIHERKANELKMRRAWDLAIAPAKSLPMQAIMLYFSGSGIQIFSIGMIFTLLIGPITALFNIFRTFETFRPSLPLPKANSSASVSQPGVSTKPSFSPLLLPMLAFIACQGLVFALGLYKCASMGILPTTSSDWLQFETRNPATDWSAVRAAFLG